MGRKVQITRQMILDGAFKLLRTEGAENISYRKLATYTGCSTQPIAWQFETIERLRIELFHYVFENMLAIVPQRVEGDSELKYLVDVNCFQNHTYNFHTKQKQIKDTICYILDN